jgi:hypothetical protein
VSESVESAKSWGDGEPLAGNLEEVREDFVWCFRLVRKRVTLVIDAALSGI